MQGLRLKMYNCVHKAPFPASQPPEWKTLHRVADNMSRSVRVSLTRGFGVFRNRADTEAIVDTWNKGKVAKIEELIPWEEFEGDLSGILAPLTEATETAGKNSKRNLPKVVKPKIRFDTSNPRLIEVIQNNVGNLITQIEETSRSNIRRVIRQSFDQGLPPRKSAKLIIDEIGLTIPQAKALENYQAAQEAAGIKGKKLQQRIERFRQRKLKERSLNIARTETIRAVNEGQKQMWLQARDEGFLDPDVARKKWVVTPDDRLCPICEGIKVLDETIRIEQDFKVPETQFTEEYTVNTPPAHPLCRCAMELVFIRVWKYWPGFVIAA